MLEIPQHSTQLNPKSLSQHYAQVEKAEGLKCRTVFHTQLTMLINVCCYQEVNENCILKLLVQDGNI
jgi:hypothetical protein